MMVKTNMRDLIDPVAAAMPGTVSARLRAMCEPPEAPLGARPAAFEGLTDGSVPQGLEIEPVALGNPCAAYARLSFDRPALESEHAGRIFARFIRPAGTARASDLAPLVLMFHDAGRPVRGWHHMTRFAALGYAVLALEGDPHIDRGDAAALSALAADALALARVAFELPGIDPERICAWGDGVGGALAVHVNARSGGRIVKTVTCGLYPVSSDDAPVSLDVMALASLMRGELLMGIGLRDELASPEANAALAHASGAEATFIVYPEHAHERINEFENAALRFLHFD